MAETKVKIGTSGINVERTYSPTTQLHRYLCEVEFDTEDKAKSLRNMVEEEIARIGGRIVQSSLGTVETNK